MRAFLTMGLMLALASSPFYLVPQVPKVLAQEQVPVPRSAPHTVPPPKPKFVDAQTEAQFLATKTFGYDIVDEQCKKFGDIMDFLFEKDGTLIAYVVGVGGFLGIGAKQVAFAPTSFRWVDHCPNYKRPVLQTTTADREQLKRVKEFTPLKPQ